MSHVTTIDCEFKDLEVLKKACARLGWEFREGQTQHQWVGTWVDDSPVPRNLFATEEEYQRVVAMPREQRCAYMKGLLDHCQHVIHLPGYEFEIGVFRVGDRWELAFDWVGDVAKVLGASTEAAAAWAKQGYQAAVNPLPQAYMLEATRQLAAQEGYCYTESVAQDGKVACYLTKY